MTNITHLRMKRIGIIVVILLLFVIMLQIFSDTSTSDTQVVKSECEERQALVNIGFSKKYVDRLSNDAVKIMYDQLITKLDAGQSISIGDYEEIYYSLSLV